MAQPRRRRNGNSDGDGARNYRDGKREEAKWAVSRTMSEFKDDDNSYASDIDDEARDGGVDRGDGGIGVEEKQQEEDLVVMTGSDSDEYEELSEQLSPNVFCDFYLCCGILHLVCLFLIFGEIYRLISRPIVALFESTASIHRMPTRDMIINHRTLSPSDFIFVPPLKQVIAGTSTPPQDSPSPPRKGMRKIQTFLNFPIHFDRRQGLSSSLTTTCCSRRGIKTSSRSRLFMDLERLRGGSELGAEGHYAPRGRALGPVHSSTRIDGVGRVPKQRLPGLEVVHAESEVSDFMENGDRVASNATRRRQTETKIKEKWSEIGREVDDALLNDNLTSQSTNKDQDALTLLQQLESAINATTRHNKTRKPLVRLEVSPIDEKRKPKSQYDYPIWEYQNIDAPALKDTGPKSAYEQMFDDFDGIGFDSDVVGRTPLCEDYSRYALDESDLREEEELRSEEERMINEIGYKKINFDDELDEYLRRGERFDTKDNMLKDSIGHPIQSNDYINVTGDEEDEGTLPKEATNADVEMETTAPGMALEDRRLEEGIKAGQFMPEGKVGHRNEKVEMVTGEEGDEEEPDFFFSHLNGKQAQSGNTMDVENRLSMSSKQSFEDDLSGLGSSPEERADEVAHRGCSDDDSHTPDQGPQREGTSKCSSNDNRVKRADADRTFGERGFTSQEEDDERFFVHIGGEEELL